MATYLLTWNPHESAWDDILEMSQAVKLGKSITIAWSCGNTRRIKVGDRIFLLRQGREPKGICASGIVVQGSYEHLNWVGKLAMYVDFQLDVLLNPDQDAILPRQLLDKGPFSKIHWNTQRSGIQIHDDVAVELEKIWASFANN